MTIYQSSMQSPIGVLRIQANDVGLTRVDFVEDENEPENLNDIVKQARDQLSGFFAGSVKVFDLPLAAKGTAFRQQVWGALCDIGYGETACYSDIANALNNPKAVRAVGAANGANPISIIVPCHRVIGKDGSLTGYASGLDRKQWLLSFEQGGSLNL